MCVPCLGNRTRVCGAIGVTPASYWCRFYCECCLQRCLISEHNCGILAWLDSCNKEPCCHLQTCVFFWSTILLTSKLLVSNGDASWAVLKLSCTWTSHQAGSAGKAKCKPSDVKSKSHLHWGVPQTSNPVIRGLDLARRLSLCQIFGVGGGVGGLPKITGLVVCLGR